VLALNASRSCVLALNASRDDVELERPSRRYNVQLEREPFRRAEEHA
jgi:hypothetical protein